MKLVSWSRFVLEMSAIALFELLVCALVVSLLGRGDLALLVVVVLVSRSLISMTALGYWRVFHGMARTSYRHGEIAAGLITMSFASIVWAPLALLATSFEALVLSGVQLVFYALSETSARRLFYRLYWDYLISSAEPTPEEPTSPALALGRSGALRSTADPRRAATASAEGSEERDATGDRVMLALSRSVAPALGVWFVFFASQPSIWLFLGWIPILANAAWTIARLRREQEELRRLADHISNIDPFRDEQVGFAATKRPIESRAGFDALRRASITVEQARVELQGHAEARTQVEQEEQVRSRFMSAAGHELRSPLNSIVGFAQLLEDGKDGPLTPEQRESIVMVRRSAQQLLRLLTDILDSARIESGRLTLSTAWTPSVEIVTDAVKQGKQVVEGSSVEIDATLQPGLPPVRVDRARIVQATLAMLRSAASGKQGGTLEVRAYVGRDRSDRPAVRIEVRDGTRILSELELERIFEAFGELRERTGRRVDGLGLALSLSRRLVRLHGGDCWAESDSRSGTRYVIALPDA